MPITLPIVALTFAGGALGTLLRMAFGSFDELIALWLVNLAGTVFLAWANHRSQVASSDARPFSTGEKAFWATGFAGGFTTMSGLATWVSVAVDDASGWINALAMTTVAILAYSLVANRLNRDSR